MSASGPAAPATCCGWPRAFERIRWCVNTPALAATASVRPSSKAPRASDLALEPSPTPQAQTGCDRQAHADGDEHDEIVSHVIGHSTGNYGAAVALLAREPQIPRACRADPSAPSAPPQTPSPHRMPPRGTRIMSAAPSSFRSRTTSSTASLRPTVTIRAACGSAGCRDRPTFRRGWCRRRHSRPSSASRRPLASTAVGDCRSARTSTPPRTFSVATHHRRPALRRLGLSRGVLQYTHYKKDERGRECRRARTR